MPQRVESPEVRGFAWLSERVAPAAPPGGRGLIYTPWSIIENLSGGKDVTAQVLAALGAPAAARPAAPAAATGTTGAPLTPR